MTSHSNIFPRRLSLKGQILIARLMAGGKWSRVYPLACKWAILDNASQGVQFVFVARKKMFKHAVDRNRCKRLMREAFRLNGKELRQYCDENKLPLKVAVLYVGQKIEDFATVNNSVKKIIMQLMDIIKTKQ